MAQLSLRTLFAVPVLTAALASAALGQQSTAPSDASLFAAREAVWRDYFANGPDLATALPENFIGIGRPFRFHAYIISAMSIPSWR